MRRVRFRAIDDGLHKGTKRLGFCTGGANALMRNQRYGQIGQQRFAMSVLAAQCIYFITVSHPIGIGLIGVGRFWQRVA